VSRWVKDLIDPNARETALLELSKQREKFPELAPYLWNSFGTMAVLLQVCIGRGALLSLWFFNFVSHSTWMQEITLIYPQLQPPELNTQTSNRVCNALALFQCVASHSETRELFLQAHIPLFLYPFLNTTSKTRPFEYLRLTALGVIGALVKKDDSTVRPPVTSIVSAHCARHVVLWSVPSTSVGIRPQVCMCSRS
jgi:CCR4-NOT transcription complex subunit 9